MKRFLAVLTAVVTLAVMLPLAGAQAASTATVKGGWLRLRQAPSFSAATITSYFTGTVVTILKKQGSWYQVITPDNRAGYMYGSYLKMGGTVTPAPSPVAPVGTATVTSANGLGVRLRTGPGTNYSVLGLYNVGTSVSILSRGTYWHYVRIGSKTGYMMAKYLKEGTSPAPAPAPAPEGTYKAWVTSANGLGVNLRTGPGKEYGSIRSYAVGTEVTVLSHGATWDYVKIGAKTGYMMTKFLTTTQQSGKVTGVTISSMNPKVGMTLKAQASPSGASVSYQWFDNFGVLLCTNQTYTVSPSELGRFIYVRVTGIGSTSGSATSSYTAAVAASDAPAPVTTPTPENTPAPAPAKTELAGTVSLPSAALPGVMLLPNVNLNTDKYVLQWYQNGVLISTGSSLTVTNAMIGAKIKVIAVPTDPGFTGQVSSKGCTIQSAVGTPSDLD